MKYAHYAPTAPMILLEGEQAKLPAAIIQHVQQAMDQGKRVGAVVSKETAKQLPPQVVVVVYGPRHSVAEMAVNLYEGLRYFDDEPVDIIYAEGIGEGGLGRAVMNRLRKAAGYQIIKV
jgi:L-threonylcarbamoyladenylate synthase